MAIIDRFILSVKRAETPLFRFLKRSAFGLLHLTVPVPSVLKPVLAFVYHLHFGIPEVFRRLLAIFYRSPLFRSRCVSVGKRLSIEQLPDISGNIRILLGDDVRISGRIGIQGGRVHDQPEFVVGNKVFIGHGSSFSVAHRIEIEDNVFIAGGTHMADFDGHPLDPEERTAEVQVGADKVRPIRICKQAWIGRNCTILKGVTIGEAAVVGTGSVVRSDVPPFAVAIGNPAQIVKVFKPQA